MSSSSRPAGYPPPPAPVALRIFEHYVRRQAGRHFSAVHWTTRCEPQRWDRSLPTIFVANHTNWWDGLLALLVTRALGLSFQVLMDARHLARYRLFRRAGALPLRRGRAREVYADLEAAAWYLRPGVGLWIFPQGERRPPGEPLNHFERGAAHLALRHGRPIRICPVGFRYSHVGEQLPEAFALVGNELTIRPGDFEGRACLTHAIRDRLTEALDALDAHVGAEQLHAFHPLANGRLSVNKRLDRLRHAMGLLRGPFEARNG